MKVEKFIVGPLQTNSYLVICEKTQESVLIDPGDVSPELLEKVREFPVKAILLTHGHFDHIGGVKTVADETGVPVLVNPLDAPMLKDPYLNGSYMVGAEIRILEPAGFLEDGEDISFGESSLKVVHTPGHTQGGVSFAADCEFVIAGDTLFKLSVGRWDLPGGDYAMLEKTIKNMFSRMEDSTIVYPGHGDITSIGYEREHNPFIRDF